MQSLVYLTEEADAHLRNGDLAMALKKYDAIHKVRTPGLSSVLVHCSYLDVVSQIFDVYEDDQFDFHGYSVRNFTINIYLKCVLGVRS